MWVWFDPVIIVCYSINAKLTLDADIALMLKRGVHKLALCWNTELTCSHWIQNARLLRLAFLLKHEATQAYILMLKRDLRSAYWKAARLSCLGQNTILASCCWWSPHLRLKCDSGWDPRLQLDARSAFEVGCWTGRDPCLSWNAGRLRSDLRLEHDLRIWQRTRGPRLGWNTNLTFGMRPASKA